MTGLGQVLRLIARRDRLRSALWFAGIFLLVAVSAWSIVGLYDTEAELQDYARLVRDNSALIVQAGPGYGLDDPTVGAVLMNEVAIWTFVAVALMSIFSVVRHTRAEEESERVEVLRSTPLDRRAPLVAALVAVGVLQVAVAAGVAVGLVAWGYPLVGSLAFGASMVGLGAVFTAIGAVTAQVATGARAAIGLAVVVLGAAFVLRAVGDVGDGRLSWVSPIGWGQAIRAYADERWWVLALPALATTALVAAAVALSTHRDLGSGLLRPRAGRARAGRALGSAAGLSVRLQRGAVVGWVAGLIAIGFFYGVVADQAEELLEDNPDFEDFFAQLGGGASLTDAFLATALLVLGLIASGFTVSSVLRLRSEEVSGHVDPVLATRTSRRRWAWSHLGVALVATVVVMAATGAAVGAGFAIVSGDSGQVLRLLGAALVAVPALAVFAGVAFALFGLAPRWSLAAWGFVATAAVVGLLGEVLDLPQWARDVSPFEHLPAVPADGVEALPLVVLVTVAAALVAVGTVGFRRRDVG